MFILPALVISTVFEEDGEDDEKEREAREEEECGGISAWH